MSHRAQEFMDKIWEGRNSFADTEEKLVALVIRTVAENVKSYTAQNGILVLDKNSMIELANEVENLK